MVYKGFSDTLKLKFVGPSVPGNSSLRGPNTSHCCKGLIKKSKFHVFNPCIDARPKCLTLPQPPPQVSVFTTLDGFLQRGHMEVFQTWRDRQMNHRATRPGTTFCMVANWLQHCLRSASYNGRPMELKTCAILLNCLILMRF